MRPRPKGEVLYENLKVTHLSVPVELLIFLANRYISMQEMLLLSLVDALRDRTTGLGCWATNRYLGTVLGVSKKHIERMVSRLRKLGLLNDGPQYQGKRTLLLDKELVERKPGRGTRRNAGGGPAEMRGYNKYPSDTKRKIGSHPFDLLCADLLMEALNSKTRDVWRWSPLRLAKHFKSLRGSIKDKKYIKDVLLWYCRHLSVSERKRINLPYCKDPKQFKQQWAWITDKYTKHAPKEVVVEVTEEALSIAKTLSGLHWPKGSKDQLPRVVQLSLEAYKSFKTKLQVYAESLTEDRDYATYLCRKLPFARTMVENWFREANRQCQSWNTWNGDLHDQKFSVDHKRFISRCRQITVEYGRRAKDFDKLMEKLNEN